MGGDVPPPVPTGSHQEYIGYNMKIKLTDKPARGKVANGTCSNQC